MFISNHLGGPNRGCGKYGWTAFGSSDKTFFELRGLIRFFDEYVPVGRVMALKGVVPAAGLARHEYVRAPRVWMLVLVGVCEPPVLRGIADHLSMTVGVRVFVLNDSRDIRTSHVALLPPGTAYQAAIGDGLRRRSA